VDTIILGLIAIGIGALIAFYGTRSFFILLPVFAFVAGFLFGAEAIAAILGEGLFASVLGWIFGLVVGVVFAVISYLWWWAAVVLLMGIVGYNIGYGLLVAIGIDPGFVPAAAGVALALVFAIAAVVLDVPAMLVTVVTGLGGAAYAVAGAYLLFGQITLQQLQDTPLGALEGKPIGLVVWLVVAVLGIGFQVLDLRRIAFERIDRSSYRYT
jgi:hypothetical protein